MQGDAGQKEEQQLRQLASDDPFLADALEGLSALPAGNHAERVERIKAQARARGHNNRRLMFLLPRIAAAVVGAGLLIGGFWYLNTGSNNRPVAMEQAKKASAPSGVLTDSATQANARHEAMEGTGAVNREQDAGPGNEPQNKIEQEEETPQLALVKPVPAIPSAQADSAPLKSDEAADHYALESLPATTQAEQPENAQGARSKMAQPAQPAPGAPRQLRGQVVDSGGQPLPGANVLVPGTRLGATTDANGNFQLALPAGENQIEVSYTGYQSVRQEVQPGEFLRIGLSESLVMDEVVVTGYGNEKEKADAGGLKLHSTQPKPSVSSGKYKKYIRNNIRYPEAARKNGTEGTVELSFQVQPDGSLSGFKVIKGLGDGCNEEAIRLLREGPKWEGAGQQGSYAVEFNLK